MSSVVSIADIPTTHSNAAEPVFAAENAGSLPAQRPGIRVNAYIVIASLAILLTLATASECHSVTSLPSLAYGFALWGWWGCVASVIWRSNARKLHIAMPSASRVALYVLLGLTLGAVHLLLLGCVAFLNASAAAHATLSGMWKSLFIINRFGIELLVYGFVLGIAGVARSQILAQRAAMRSLDLERQLSVAHLRALQMQLEPHFLLNTLNAITTLVELGRQQQAAAMLAHLNAMLKSTLQQTMPEKVPLSQELDLVENYLAIEQVRFADRLRVAIKVEPGALDGLVPCFLLQPIVENAIRHGIARCEHEGTVEASVRRDGGSLHLRVRDSGAGLHKTPQNGHGIGLRNTRERLAHFYHGAYAMQASALDAGGFEVAITIPYERASR